MEAPAFLICLFMFVASQQVEALQPFLSDLVDLFDTSSITIIIGDNFNEEYDASDIDFRHPISFMRYTSEEEVGKIIEHLLLQRSFEGDLDLILFLGRINSELLRNLINKEKFFNSGVSGLLPEDDYGELELALQLNTKLYFYEWKEGRMVLKERYSITDIPVEKNVGSWIDGAGFQVEEARIWERRSDFLGAIVRVASVDYPPWHELYYEDPTDKTKVTGGGGFFIEPMKYLAERLNFSIEFKYSVDGNWGGTDSDGNWNGMIGMVVRDEADVAAAGLTRTMARDNVAPFSVTLWQEESTLAVPVRENPATNFWVFFDVFPKITWVVIGLTILVIALGFAIIKCSVPNNPHHVMKSEEMNFFNAMGLSAFPSELEFPYNICMDYLSSRILFLFGGVVIFVLFSHYEANLTASMTSGAKDIPIKSFDDVIKGEYKVIVEQSTAMQEQMETAKEGSAMRLYYDEKMRDNPDAFYGSVPEGLEILDSEDKTLTFASSMDGFLPAASRLNFLNIQGHTTTFSQLPTYKINNNIFDTISY